MFDKIIWTAMFGIAAFAVVEAVRLMVAINGLT